MAGSNVVDLAATAVRDYGKNKFRPKPFEHIWTQNTGEIIPGFATVLVNPGSTWNITTSILARLNTSRYPTIARGWVEYMWVYVPHNQVWDHWNQMQGENEESAWVSQTTYVVPKIAINAGVKIKNGDLMDHFGWPTETEDFKASALKLRAYNWACDQIARDQNIEAPFAPDTGDADIIYVPGGSHTVGGKPYQINRKADIASTALPEPYKGPDVLLSLGQNVPVFTRNTNTEIDNDQVPLRWRKTNGNTFDAVGSRYALTGEVINSNQKILDTMSLKESSTAANQGFLQPANLWAKTEASEFELTQIRDKAVALHIFERDARSGTRTEEMLWARWGVEVDPLELGKPRILTMGRFDIQYNQVAQTSSSDANSPQGTLTAFGYTNNRNEDGTFSFKYHGTLMCLVTIRFEHKYQQGIPMDDMKFERFDFWHPEFAGLGDQPYFTWALYATGGANGTMKQETIFGYTERGAEYRNFPSIITGQVRSNYAESMDYVHMADYYEEEPTLSPEWMKENPYNLDRTIFVSSEYANQWLVDFVAEFEITDTLPLYSIPGIDRI